LIYESIKKMDNTKRETEKWKKKLI
jgi:hypothetical protein